MVLVYAFGAGFVGIGVLMLGLMGMLEGPDRRALLNLLRHPIRAVYGPDAPPDEED
jgi:hypothetical protein